MTVSYLSLIHICFYIVGEHSIKITQNLLGIKGAKLEDITYLYSHEQGLQQSSKFLNDHPKIKACLLYTSYVLPWEVLGT